MIYLWIMFRIIKKIFSSQEKIIQMKAEELEKYFFDEYEKQESRLKERIDGFWDFLGEKTGEFKPAVEELLDAELRNKNITTRESQFMEGNRKAYVQKVELFLRQVDDAQTGDIHVFFERYNNILDDFTKGSQRSYRILQDFFAHESRNIALKIKDIDSAINSMKRDPEFLKYEKMDTLKKEIESAANKKKKKQELLNEKKEICKEIENISFSISDQEKWISGFKDSASYKEIKALSVRISDMEKRLKEMRTELYSQLSPLERLFRKYERIALEDTKIIEHYETDSFSALLTDHDLRIVNILGNIKNALLKNSIQDKNKEKVMQIIDRLDREYLVNFRDDYQNIREELKKTENDHAEKQRDLFLHEDKVDSLKRRKETLVEKERSREDELRALDIKKTKEEIRQELEKIIGVRIVLT